jgi:hypothetical protein
MARNCAGEPGGCMDITIQIPGLLALLTVALLVIGMKKQR